MQQVANTWMWMGFSTFLIIALAIDARVHAKHPADHHSLRKPLYWTLFWVCSAFLFNFLLWIYLKETTDDVFAKARALEFLAGYLIEKSLSIDNLFVFYMVFHHFRIPAEYQQRVFSYGIWTAVVLRLIFILLGVWLLAKFHWLLYLMGAFLLFTGIKMFFVSDKENDLTETMMMKFMQRHLRITPTLHENKFFVWQNNLLYATPLFITLLYIEFSDVIFAFDSIPAIFAVTRDPFIIWTSNIFAILGLRALYFVLASMVNMFNLLKFGVALILIFIGGKMVVEPWLYIPVAMSLIIIGTIIAVFTMLSMVQTRTGR